MPSKTQIREIKTLARSGKSVNEIKNILGLPKSTVYYHFRKEVGQKQKKNSLTVPDDKEFQGELCGVFAGDGNFYRGKNYHYRIRITLNVNQRYWKALAFIFENNLGKTPMINPQRQYNRINLRYSSKTLYNFLNQKLYWNHENKTFSISKRPKKKFSKQFDIGFLRGLMDTDGTLKHKTYVYSTISRKLASNISNSLNTLGIDNKIREDIDRRENCRNIFRVIVDRKNSQKLMKYIEPRHHRKRIVQN